MGSISPLAFAAEVVLYVVAAMVSALEIARGAVRLARSRHLPPKR